MRTLEMLEALKERFEEFYAMRKQLEGLKDDLDELNSSIYDMTTNIENTTDCIQAMMNELEMLED